jgi:formylglycine-generating enzyme required for sulfatase activity
LPAALPLLLVPALSFRGQDKSPAYAKAAAWQEAMYAAREKMEPLDGVATGVWRTSDRWAGTAYTLDTVLPPETGASGVRWTERPEWRDMSRRLPKPSVPMVFYDRCSFFSDSTRTITVQLNSPWSLAAWLNGKEIFRGNLAAVKRTPGSLQLSLNKGENDLLIKFSTRGYNSMGPDPAYVFTIARPDELQKRRDAAMTSLWAKLRAGFTDARSLRELSREERDGIWVEDWPKGDVSILAGKYAALVGGPAAKEARDKAPAARTQADLAAVRASYNASRNLDEVREILREVHPEAVNLAVDDLISTFGPRYAKGPEYRRALSALEKDYWVARAAQSDDAVLERLGERVRQYQAVSREALLANSMLDFDRILIVRRNFGKGARAIIGPELGLPVGNSWTNDDIRKRGWDNQIAVLSNLRGAGRLTTFYQPDGSKIVSDVDLDFDASRVMFSSIGSSERWRLFELKANGSGLRQITPDLPDVDHFDSCYLPDGRITFASTSAYQAMPCINGGAPMAQLFTSDGNGQDTRQITFEQDSDWTPSVHENGKLLYLRWEYTDIAHYFTRLPFHANPDGTNQIEYFGSNSFFPNGVFYPRSIPGHPSAVVGIVSGHHGLPRTGRLMVFDPALGRDEANPVVQEIPGRGRKVDAIIRDPLIEGVWPQFLHPYPLADYRESQNPALGGKYFLAAMKRDAESLWGIYLVDTFDNITLIKEVEGAALLEPIPFRAVPRPPVLQDRTRPGEKDATVYLSDVYSGPGLSGIPRGTVKSLRVFSYHYNYNNTGGHASVGVQSGWDIKRILGTVPVEADGSASFKIPANTPITVQPLDDKGRALQLMRSWLTGMPGEVVSCVGCHDRQNSTPLSSSSIASRRAPSAIQPWYGPPRPFAFRTEVQPVLDRYCVSCHDGRRTPAGRAMPNFVSNPESTFFTDDRPYLALQKYVHRYGPENDYALQKPMEYHASTSPLFQILDRGHHGVKLDQEAYDRLVTWTDLNAPWRGSWGEDGVPGRVPRFRDFDQVSRRVELAKRYANVDTDPEREYELVLAELARRGKPTPVMPAPQPETNASAPTVAGWPFDQAEAQRKQQAAGWATERSFELGNGARLDLTLVPAGSFPMAASDGSAPTPVHLDKPFYMGRFEITNRQYQSFDHRHDSRYIDQQGKDHNNPGYPANLPDQPVIRVTWDQAMAFCRWLSEKTGERFTLPTEAQWEWASRAGSAGPLWFGKAGSDFGKFANLADSRIQGFRSSYSQGAKRGFFFTHFPFSEKVNDGSMISSPVGQYQPNPWGLFDMHGNVAEWTIPAAGAAHPLKPARGGSWRDLPEWATATSRIGYQSFQPVWDVGFRVVLDPGSQRASR